MLDRRELSDLWIAVGVALSLIVYHIASTLTEALPGPLALTLHNGLFVWILGLLWIAYRRWQEARGHQGELESFLRNVSTELVLVLDRQRRILLCNEAIEPMFGYTPAEVLGKTPDMLYGDRRKKADRPTEIRDSMERIGIHLGTATGVRKNGVTLDLEISSTPMRNRSGAILVVRDVSEKLLSARNLDKARMEADAARAEAHETRRNTEQLRGELDEARKLAADLTSMILHELRPALESLRGSHAEGEAQRKVARAADLANDLFDIHRIESGTFALQRADHALSSLVANACSASGQAAAARGIAIEVQSPDASATLDGGVVTRVLSHLVAQAVLRSPANEPVTVSCLAEERLVRFEVRDRGPGMTMKSESRFFEKFARLPSPRPGADVPPGLALAFCKLAVEAHGGHIGITSKAGSGCLFWFEIPAVPRLAEVATA